MNINKAKLKELLKYPLSGDDIKRALDDQYPIYTYSELSQFETLNDAWGPKQGMVILYETRKNVGHWCCCFMGANGRINVFDSYGIRPDNELKWIESHFRKESNQKAPHLSFLMYQTGLPVEYNEYKLQRMSNDIATCGRFCIVRLFMRDLGVKEFAHLLKNNPVYKDLSPDEIVTIVTYGVIGK